MKVVILVNIITILHIILSQWFSTIKVHKKHISNHIEISRKLSRQLVSFIQNNYYYFLTYDRIKVYYDNGQIELTRILFSVLTSLLPNVTFRKALPSQYRLFQVTDLICTLELIRLKLGNKALSKHEMTFWGKESVLKKNYLQPIYRKELITQTRSH